MKFVIHFPNRSNPATLSASQFAGQDFGVATQAPFEAHLGCTSVVCSMTPNTRSNLNGPGLLFWDGAFISDDGAYSHLIDNRSPSAEETAISSYLDGVYAGETPVHLSGVFGAARIDKDGSFVLAPDPLSQYAFFRFERSGHTLISNSLHLIEKACDQLGFACERDFASNAFEAAFGIGGWTKTGLSGVEKLPPGYAAICDGETVTFKRFSNPWAGNTVYQDQIQPAATGLMNRALGLSKSLPDDGIVLDLSGGKDTRVVLSSFLGAGAKNFRVFTGGAEQGSDRQVAYQLINLLGLERGGFLSNVGPDEVIDPIAATARAAYRSMGSSNLYHATLGTQRLRNCAQVRGGCAEARTKSFFHAPNRLQQLRMLKYIQSLDGSTGWRSHLKRRIDRVTANFPTRLAAQLFARGKFTHTLFTPDFLQEAASSFRTQIEWLMDQGISEQDLRDAYYLYDRGWRHSGFPVQVMNDSRPTFEPLNDVRLIAAQSALSPRDRDQAKLSFDLLSQFGVPELIEVPFAAGDWPSQFMNRAQMRNRETLQKTTVRTPQHATVSSPKGRISGIHNLGRQNYMDAVQHHFLALAGDLHSSSGIWSMLNRDELLAAIQSGDFTTNKFATVGSRLYYGLVWITGQEERTVLE